MSFRACLRSVIGPGTSFGVDSFVAPVVGILRAAVHPAGSRYPATVGAHVVPVQPGEVDVGAGGLAELRLWSLRDGLGGRLGLEDYVLDGGEKVEV